MGVIANNCNPQPVDLMYEYGFWLAVAAVVIIIAVGLIFICSAPRGSSGDSYEEFLEMQKELLGEDGEDKDPHEDADTKKNAKKSKPKSPKAKKDD
eukprot:TRINITY_DN1599_c0_g1_i2.p1 TRINITY_DN1599_c0_g1~~TRINITY_DN1599_c0_g1_i2.p1  ORF type:complete len:112 (-),score=13.14 TRINITY_DN1599_c0_g1_i2:183-470(-)